MSNFGKTIRGGLMLGCAVLLLQVGQPAEIQAQGMRYTAQPGVSWVQWDDALGLDDIRMNGGSAGIGFGRYVGLRGYYFTKDALTTGFESVGFVDPAAPAVPNQFFDMSNYGGELTIGLGAGNFVPTIMGGGGIMRFRPEAGEEQKRIELKYGAGVRTYLGESLELEVMLERNQFRLSPLDLAAPLTDGDPDLPAVDDEGGVRRNLAIRLGLGFQLGSRDFARGSELDQAVEGRYQRPFSNLALSLQPFVGRQQFDDALGYGDRDVAGFTGGLDFGSFVGLRGFYWRGVNDDFDAFEGLRGYGAEAQFNLSDGQGMAPYLIAGAGQMEFDADFDTLPDLIPADQKAVILGGGVDFNFGSRVRLSATARDYIMAGSDFVAGGDLERVATPSDIIHNWQFSAGLKLLVGAGRGVSMGRPPTLPVPPTVIPSQEPAATAAAPTTEPSPELTALVERMEAAAVRAEEAAERAEETRQAQVDAGRVTPEAPHMGALPSTAAAAVDPAGAHAGMAPRTDASYGQAPLPANPWITPNAAGTPYGPVIVVPMPWPMPWGQGALGTAPAPAAAATPAASSLNADQLRELVRSELARVREGGETAAITPPSPPEPGITAGDLAVMEERLAERMSATLERERRVTEEIARQEADAAVARRVPVPVEERREVDQSRVEEPSVAAPAAEEGAARRIRLDPSLGFPVRELRPYSGMTFGEGSQMVLGLAMDWGPFQSGSRFDLVPEASVAFGAGEPTWMAAANLQYRTGWILERDSFWINPLAQIGLGLTNRDSFEAVLNAAYGATIQLSGVRGRNGAPLNLYVAHQGIDLFNRSSLIIGISLER